MLYTAAVLFVGTTQNAAAADGLILGLEETLRDLPGPLESARQGLSAVAQGLRWAGGPDAWTRIVLCAVGSLSIGLIAAILAKRMLASRLSSVGLQAASYAVFLVAGALLPFALPVHGRERTVAIVLFLAVAAVVLLGSIGAAAYRKALPTASRRPVERLIYLCLSIAAASYLLLGLVRVSHAAPAERLVVALVLWTMLTVAVVRLLSAVLADYPKVPAGPPGTLLADPARRIFHACPGWFFGALVGLIALGTAVRMLRFGADAFIEGVGAFVLVAALPITVSFVQGRLEGLYPGNLWSLALGRSASLVLFIAFWLLLAILLGINPFIAASETFGQRTVRILIDIGIAVALGLLFWQLAGTALDVLAPRAVPGRSASRPHVSRPSCRWFAR